MEKDVDLSLIRYEFQDDSDETQIFLNICRDHELDPPLESTINTWFKRFHDFDLSLRNEIGEFNYNLLREIILQCSKFNHAIFSRDDNVWNHNREEMIRSRFKLVGNCAASSFEVFDTFNEGVKIIRTGINPEVYYPALITHDRILLISVRGNDYYLQLLDAGFDQLNSLVLDESPIEFVCFHIILDSSDNLRFLLRCGFDDEDTSVYKGHVVDDKIHLNDQEIPFEVELFCCKLKGDQLFAFQREQEDEDGWNYTEYDLSLNSARKVNQWSCSGFPNWTRIFNKYHRKYVWSDNKLYAVNAFRGYFSVLAFDSNTLTWSNTNFIGAGCANELIADEEEILSISAIEHYNEPIKSKVVYRLPMRKPDKLRYIAWFKIRREAIFFGSTLYKRLAPQLPYTSEFREFSDNY